MPKYSLGPPRQQPHQRPQLDGRKPPSRCTLDSLKSFLLRGWVLGLFQFRTYVWASWFRDVSGMIRYTEWPNNKGFWVRVVGSGLEPRRDLYSIRQSPGCVVICQGGPFVYLYAYIYIYIYMTHNIYKHNCICTLFIHTYIYIHTHTHSHIILCGRTLSEKTTRAKEAVYTSMIAERPILGGRGTSIHPFLVLKHMSCNNKSNP